MTIKVLYHKGCNDGFTAAYCAWTVLAWEYWHPNEPIPTLIQYVQDRDLWKKQLSHSDEVFVMLRSFKMDFEVWDTLAHLSSENFLTLARMIGSPILQKRQQDVEAIASTCTWIEIANYRVPTVHTSKPSLASDLGHYLCNQFPDAPFSAISWIDRNGKTKWSLRSIGNFDVSQIAKQFGGGGHRNAAGFEQASF